MANFQRVWLVSEKRAGGQLQDKEIFFVQNVLRTFVIASILLT